MHEGANALSIKATRGIALLLLNSALFFTTANGLLTVFPLYIISRGGNELAVGLLVGLYSLSAVLLRVLFAKFASRLGPKWLLMAGIFIAITGPLLYLLDFGLWYLALVRIYHAGSLATFVMASQTLLADLSTEANRGRIFGLYGVVGGLSMAVAPALGQYVAVNFGYTAFFSSSALFGLLMVPGQILLKEPAIKPQVARPLGGVYRNRWVLVSSLGIFSVTMALGGLSSFLPLHATAQGLTEMGLYFAAFSLTFMASGYVAGTLSDRFGRQAIAAPSFLLITLGLLCLTQLVSYPVLIVCGLVIGLGFGAVNTALMALVMDKTSSSERSHSVSFFNNSFDLGISGGAMLLGKVAASSFGLLWTVLAAVTMLGFALILFALPRN